MDADEISRMRELLNLFPDKELLVVSGRHYGTFAAEYDTEGKDKFFISMGDAEAYIENRDDTSFFLSGEGLSF
jgi:predicted nucleic acid-binding Zn finger protein